MRTNEVIEKLMEEGVTADVIVEAPETPAPAPTLETVK